MFRDTLRKAPADQLARLTEPGAASVAAADNAALRDALPLLDVDPSRLPEDLQRRPRGGSDPAGDDPGAHG
ncbi:hypothetical protein SCWH03_19310 [Streptomyces pacificus]|uniref:Uncharacterized protein n=1 Tax=Streptomyces pacificus TaxID=2705029 RepID=A0A6A0AS13_9ACTN|nr:hypothetical protein SCWH03_19310 [Streptomyces pacificus]